jgi:superfamily II DNA or RNA helicase
MDILKGNIVKNIIATEPVEITSIQDFGTDVSIEYTGVNTKQNGDIILSKDELDRLKLISQKGSFDFSGDPAKFTLYTEAERIKSAFQFDPLFAVNCSVVDPLPHQVEAVYKYMLPLPRMRFLLADDTGAGKTIMTGLLIKELILRGLIERILIITPGGLTKQWQEDEMGLKFNFQFKLVDRPIFNSDPNIFNNSNKLVTSIDFIRNEDVLNVLKDSTWDLIVVDEAHKLSAYDYGTKRYRSKRYEAIELLAPQTEHLLLLTATPHRGRQDTFRNLLQLLDKDIFSTNELVTNRINNDNDDVTNKFFIRRLKEDMTDWQGGPLFKPRHTKTVEYKLTEVEKKLYDQVTKYLTVRREEAAVQNNIHVSLALMVMQRRLTSSIYAIMRTLQNRYNALNGLVELIRKNPTLWSKRMEYEVEFDDYDDYSELSDDERESLERIFSDPRKFKLFTTAKSIQDIEAERNQVLGLKELAEELYHNNTEEQKLKRLWQFLTDENVSGGRKLVLFTEHKDTLDYLEKKLTNQGYKVETIYGQKSVDERRKAQDEFAGESQILLATDAAGEGINLQFCNLLINWDIPWNPNRLEQRMGRIHRYGQKEEVYVFNLVAQNTREGKVMNRLLQKLDIIREQIGSDRVYDVISDVFQGVNLEDILKSTLQGEVNSFNNAIDNDFTTENVKDKIKAQKEKLACKRIDFESAKKLMDDSLEKRLIPIYLERFFKKSFISLGGVIKIENDFIHLKQIPKKIKEHLKEQFNIGYDITKMMFTFHKEVFLDKKKTGKYERLYYLNPGNPIYDATVELVLSEYKEEVLKGTILVSPEEKDPYFAYFVRSQITDKTKKENITDEKLALVCGKNDELDITSPAKLIDLVPPVEYAKKIDIPEPVSEEQIVRWSFVNITNPQFEEAKIKVKEDIELRKEYLDQGISSMILNHTLELTDLREKLLLGNDKVQDKVEKLEQKIIELEERKEKRMSELDQRMQLNRKSPKVIGSAYVVPLSQVEYNSHYGMSRDDEVEQIAMDIAMKYEKEEGWLCEDVSSKNLGFDLKSVDPELIKRYIEVKGRAAEGPVMISENEMNRLKQLGKTAWLYIVSNCKSNPTLHRVNDPGNNLNYKELSKGIQYLVSLKEWKSKSKN